MARRKKSKAKKRLLAGQISKRNLESLEQQKAGASKVLKELHYNGPKRDENKEEGPSHDLNDDLKLPRSIVIKNGKVNKSLQSLVGDLRKVMSPYTALHLRERGKASLKDYVAVSSHLKVSHILAIGQSKKSTTLMIGRTPVGPTITFRIDSYALMKTIRKKNVGNKKKRYVDPSKSFDCAPLVVLNNFEGFGDISQESMKQLSFVKSKAIALTGLTMQSMFPQLNISTIKVEACRRVVLFSYNADKDLFYFRHYLITIRQKGVSKNLRKVLSNTKDLDLSKFKDFDEVLDNQTNLGYATSDSEAEDRGNEIKLRRDLYQDNAQAIQDATDRLLQEKINDITVDKEGIEVNAIRLSEVGPRLTLKLIKIEEGMFGGEVKFHAFVKRSEEEMIALREKKENEKQLKEKRKREQQENVARKKAKKKAKVSFAPSNENKNE